MGLVQPHYKTSKITGRTYDIFSQIKILNLQQSYFYLKEGVELQDIELSEDRNNGNPLMVFIFKREDTKSAFDKWCNNKQ